MAATQEFVHKPRIKFMICLYTYLYIEFHNFRERCNGEKASEWSLAQFRRPTEFTVSCIQEVWLYIIKKLFYISMASFFTCLQACIKSIHTPHTNQLLKMPIKCTSQIFPFAFWYNYSSGICQCTDNLGGNFSKNVFLSRYI